MVPYDLPINAARGGVWYQECTTQNRPAPLYGTSSCYVSTVPVRSVLGWLTGRSVTCATCTYVAVPGWSRYTPSYQLAITIFDKEDRPVPVRAITYISRDDEGCKSRDLGTLCTAAHKFWQAQR